MTPVRYLTPLLASVACASPPHEHRAPDQPPTAQQSRLVADTGRPPCDSLASCGDWVIQTPAFLHGKEPARFSGSFRTIGDTIRLWFDTSRIVNGQGEEWIAVDSAVAILKNKEVLAQACGFKGKELDGQLVAIVRDTVTDKYPPPRLAWYFDVQTARIKPVPPDSAHCEREYAGE